MGTQCVLDADEDAADDDEGHEDVADLGVGCCGAGHFVGRRSDEMLHIGPTFSLSATSPSNLTSDALIYCKIL